MEKKPMKREALRKLILAAILSALILVMTVMPFTGYISYGVIEITTLHIVVILGAVLLGWRYGALLGLVWGVTCLVRAYAMPIYLPFGFGNPLVSVLPRVIVGAVAGLVFEALKKTRLRNAVSLGVATVAGSLTNTVLVLSAMSIFCKTSVYDTVKSIFATLIGINGVIEIVAAIVIIPPIYFALQPRESVLGVDFGASTTKLAVVRNGRCIRSVRKRDDETLEAALERIGTGDVTRVAVTGVGASYLAGDVAGLPTRHVDEFTSLYRGASRTTRRTNMLVVSVGTGTSFVRVTPIRAWHVGGTGIGGGMLYGLSERLLGTHDMNLVMEKAKGGDLSRVDLLLKDVCSGTISNLTPTSTVANLQKLGTASEADTALGILNLTFQSIGVLAAFAAKTHWTRTIVLAGTITDMPVAVDFLSPVAELHGVTFLVPEHAPFITAIGAALI